MTLPSNKTITERENALRVLTRSGDPQWVPIVNDCMHMIFSSEVHERPAQGQDGTDWFGCHWVWDAATFGFAPDLSKPMLVEDITEWRDVVTFPDLDSIDFEAAAARDLADIDREQVVLRLFMESGPMERSHHLLGFEGAFVAMYEEPEEFKALIDAIADYKVKLIHKLMPTYRPDEVFAQDDLGGANAPMFSLEIYRELIKPAHARISEAIRSYGAIHTHHSCGRMEAFIDDLIDVGVHVLNPIQNVNDRKMIAEKYSDILSFDIGADAMAAREDSTEEDVRAEIREIIDLFGPQKNLMLMIFPSNVNCIEKYDIAIDEARKYGSRIYA